MIQGEQSTMVTPHKETDSVNRTGTEKDAEDERSSWCRESDDGPLHAHWDCFSGAAGDMMLAACLDSIPSPEKQRALLQHVQSCLENGLEELKGEFSIEAKRVWRGGRGSIAATHVLVRSRYNHEPAPVPTATMTTNPENEKPDRDADDTGHSHHHSHCHTHQHEHSHSHSHEHASQDSGATHHGEVEHTHSHNHSEHNSRGPLRNLPQIKSMLMGASCEYVPVWVRDHAMAAFEALAQAEAETHGASSMETVHFHEVGAVDSIVDTVGTLVALHALGVETISCSRLPLGEGTVWTDHGLLPVPAPATARLLRGMAVCPGPITKGEVTGELVTPTAAALLKVLVSSPTNKVHGKTITPGRPPNFTLRHVGIGAGSKDFMNHPNIIRLLLGNNVVSA